MEPFVKDEKGAITTIQLIYLMIFMFILFTMILALGYGARNKSMATYMWFGAAMDYAAQAANITGYLDQTELNAGRAELYFKHQFAAMTKTQIGRDTFIPKADSPYPGPIILKKFIPVNTGDPLSGGTARQPGYLAEIEVPVFGGNVPLVGHQYITRNMEYFAVVRSTRISQ